MNSYLMYRAIHDNRFTFCDRKPEIVNIDFQRTAVKNSSDLIEALEYFVTEATSDGKTVLALSGGIDSAILARFMPKGSTAYTFRCIVSGVKVTDETELAAYYAKVNGLKHIVIDIYWDDIIKNADLLMLHKGAPIHSIEAQIYEAASAARKNGFTKMIFGENADIIYGGMDGLLKKDWTFGEFVDRYSYILPYKVLKEPQMILEPFQEFERNGHIDGYAFTNKYFRQEALGTYNNACSTAGIEFIGPYSMTEMTTNIDYDRIRSGETKYLVREAFRQLYPNTDTPQKIPMPRPMNEWMEKWNGPQRGEFFHDCSIGMSGDQKWMLYALERYLTLCDTNTAK